MTKNLRRIAILAVVAVSALAGCTERTEPRVPVERTIRDGTTLHAADVTRVWYLETGPDGRDRVLYCDTALLQQAHTLCIRWPN